MKLRPFVLCVVFAATCCGQDVLQPLEYLQKVTLTGRAPQSVSTVDRTLPQMPPIFQQTQIKPSPKPAVQDGWYTRAQLNRACYLDSCPSTDFCWGNPNGNNDHATVQPDGMHHQFCCRFANGNVTDPSWDSTQLREAVRECNHSMPAAAMWCVSGDDRYSGAKRCEDHGGEVVWNYANGHIHQGADANGRCLTLDEARRLAQFGLNPPPPPSPSPSAHCCGKGDYAFVPGRGWDCVFNSTADMYACYPGRDACLGPNGVECCGHGVCVLRGTTWGCQFDPGYNASDCPTGSELASPESVAHMQELAKELKCRLDSVTRFIDSLLNGTVIRSQAVGEATQELSRLTQQVDQYQCSLESTPVSRKQALVENPNAFNTGLADDAAVASPKDMIDFMSQWVASYSDRITTDELEIHD